MEVNGHMAVQEPSPPASISPGGESCEPGSDLVSAKLYTVSQKRGVIANLKIKDSGKEIGNPRGEVCGVRTEAQPFQRNRSQTRRSWIWQGH